MKITPSCSSMEAVLGIWDSVDNPGGPQEYLDALVNHRNLQHPWFIKDDNVGEPDASSLELFETSTMEESNKTALELELERLRLQDSNLKAEMERITTSRNIMNQITQADVEKYESKTTEVNKQVEKNKKEIKELVRKKTSLKEEKKETILMTKEVNDRIDFLKQVVQKFCNVSSDFLCQDGDFCQEFNGGKCNSKRDTGKE